MSQRQTPVAASRPLVPNATLGLVLFLASEAMFFAGLISAFLVLRAEALVWPPPDQPRLPVGVTAVNTAILLASGWTMHRSLGVIRQAGQPGRWLDATAFLGSLFLVIQGYEWVRLVRFGLTTSSSLYGGTFYTLVGAHGVHVLAALIVLMVVTLRARRGRYTSSAHQGMALCRMYWLFVVGVWPVLYVLVYLT